MVLRDIIIDLPDAAELIAFENANHSLLFWRELTCEVGRLWEEGCSNTHSSHERIDFFILVNG